MIRIPKKGKTASVIIFALLLTASAAALPDFEVLCVKRIEVYGNKTVSSGSIADACAPYLGKSLLAADKSAIRESVETDPYLCVRSVRRILPDTVKITVRERKPCAAIETDDGYLLMDEEGTLLENRAVLGEERSLPVIRGIGTVSAPLGGQADTGSDAMKKAKTLLSELRLQNAEERVIGIDMSNVKDILLSTDCGIEVEMGTARRLDEKVAWLKELLPLLAEEKRVGVLRLASVGKGAAFRPYRTEKSVENTAKAEKIR